MTPKPGKRASVAEELGLYTNFNKLKLKQPRFTSGCPTGQPLGLEVNAELSRGHVRVWAQPWEPLSKRPELQKGWSYLNGRDHPENQLSRTGLRN